MPSSFAQTRILNAHVIENVHGLVRDLCMWTLEANISKTRVNKFLKILSRHGLPVRRCARTVHRTPRKTTYVFRAGGKYIYNGIQSGVQKILSTLPNIPTRLKLQFNIDGARLQQTRNESMWPILCMIPDQPFRPFIVGLYLARQKPTPFFDFLHDFSTELRSLIQNGMEYNGNHIEVLIHSFVCDAPARAAIKGVKGHTGYYSCERCSIKGYHVNGSLAFVCDGSEVQRTDSAFSAFAYSGEDEENYTRHQLYKSPLSSFVPCVTSFVLDAMHLVFLGVTKRLIEYWKKGPDVCRISAQHLQIVSDRISDFAKFIPPEFAHKLIPLSQQDSWKATDYRTFLIYVGPIVLRDVLTKEMYRHFMSLSAAIYILCLANDEQRNLLIPYAKSLLLYFNNDSPRLYTASFVTYNVHGLIHVSEDVERFNEPLPSLWAFPFESFMRYMKEKVHGSRSPILQIINRVQELENCSIFPRREETTMKIAPTPPNNCFLLKSKQIFVIIDQQNGMFTGRIIRINRLDDIFNCGIDSTDFNIGQITRVSYNKCPIVTLNSLSIHKKCLFIENACGFVVFPLCHAEK